MIVLGSDAFASTATDAPVTPLNAIWCGVLNQKMVLPKVGHFFLVFPLAETAVSCVGTIIDNDHYILLTKRDEKRPFTIESASPDQPKAQLLILMPSPDFIAEMAGFLNLPTDLSDLLHGIPLLHGDEVSQLMQRLAVANKTVQNHEETEELFFEVVGKIMHLMILRHQTMLSLLGHKQNTITDLMPRMLQARQFIEAQYAEPIKTLDVANHVALSEYHFARLFKAAFEVTVHQFVVRLRLDKARQLLEFTETSVTEMAYKVGYSSLSAFINAFRQRFDLTPSAYRIRQKGQKN